MKKIILLILLLVMSFQISITINADHHIDYESLFENHQSVMIIIHPETGIIYYANQAASNFYGYPIDVLIGMSIDDINTLTPDEILLERQKALDEERNFFIFKHRLANGNIKTDHVYSYPIEVENEVYLFSIVIDQTRFAQTELRNQILSGILTTTIAILAITMTFFFIKTNKDKEEIKNSKNLIEEEERRKEVLLSNLPGVAYRCLYDEYWTMVYISDKFYQLTGYHQDDFIHNKVYSYAEIIHPDFLDKVRDIFDEAVKNQKPAQLTYQIITKSGDIKWVSEYAKYTKSKIEHDSDYIEGYIVDITDQIKAEKESQHYKKMLEYIIGNSNQAMAVFDNQMNYLFVSLGYPKLYRLPDMNLIGKNHYDVFPEIPQKWRDIHKRCLNGETLYSDHDWFKRPDGSIDHTKWRIVPWYHEDSKEIGGIILYTEIITSLVQAQIELKNTKDQLQLVMDHLPIGIAVNSVNPKVEFSYMNDKFPEIYRTTKEKLKDSDAFWESVYEDPIYREEIKERVLSDLTTETDKDHSWEDIPITRKGAKTHYVTAHNIKIPKSDLWISTVMDVTERKEKENEVDYASKHDFLTGIPNRRYFDLMIEKYDKEKYFPLGIAMLDMNGLKLINDVYGHESGNLALIETSKVIKNVCQDICLIARIGGDEFGMICPNISQDKMEDIKKSINQKMMKLRIGDINYSLSFGYQIKNQTDQKISNIMNEAENHMYKNKVLYGNTVRNESITSILNTLKNKYEEERVHSDRVSRYCRLIGEKLKLRTDEVKELEMAGMFHDIGKITIPDVILDKPGKLSPEEWEVMKQHTINGYQILHAADKYSRLAEYALSHHERMDGTGYPNGIKGEDIPLFSRIICVADAYEAMTSNRPYRKAMKQVDAILELKKHSGTQFDPNIVELFIHEVLTK